MTASYHRYHLTRLSKNGKVTGHEHQVAVTTSSKELCPNTCPFKEGGCYGNLGPINLHWSAVTMGTRGTGWDQHLRDLAALPPKRFIRLNQVGDLPDAAGIRELGKVLRNRTAWTYSHHRDPKRLAAIAAVNKQHGLVINLSANNPEDADAMVGKGGPIAVAIPLGHPVNSKTPGGLRIVACPEQTGKTKSCATCGNGLPLCARPRTYAIGFYPHGPQKAKAAAIAAKESK